jgi:hypothetical protein
VKHQKTSEDQQTNEDDMTKHEWVNNYDAKKFIAGLHFTSCRKAMKAVCTRNLRWFCSVAVSQENMAGYTWSIPLMSPTAEKCRHV